MEKNPTRQVQVPSLVNARDKTTLTPEQVRALLGELKEPCRTMVLLAVLSELRRGEIFRLLWKCVDFYEGSVIVAESSYEGHASAPKTRASRRKVFVDTPAIEALSRARPADANPESLVFCTDRGTAFNPNNVRNRVLVSACKRAKIPRYRGTIFATRIPLGQIRLARASRHHKHSWGTRIRDSRYRFTHNRCRKRRSCWRVKSPAFCSVLLPNPKYSGQRQES